MASTVRSHHGEAGLWKMLAIGVLALLAFIWWNTYTAAGARAVLEQQRNIEMALESRTLCERWGMPAGTKNSIPALPTSRRSARTMRNASWKTSGFWEICSWPTDRPADNART